MRSALDRGSGSVTSLALIGACVVLALGGLGGTTVILRVTAALREAENIAATIATRALAGDSTPCEPVFTQVEKCVVDHGIATVRVRHDGTVATAIAGPER